MTESRIFLGNLPPSVSESDLQEKVKSLGTLSDITIKKRTDHEGRVTATFAHCCVTSEDINKCLDKFMLKPWDGFSVKAEIAKKSAQQRLQETRTPHVQNGYSAPAPPKAAMQKPFVAEKKFTKPEKPIFKENKIAKHDKPVMQEKKFTKPEKPPPQKIYESSSDSEEEVYWKPNAPKAGETVEMESSEPVPKRKRREEEAPTKLYMAKSTNAQSDLLRRLESFSSVWGDDEQNSYSAPRQRNRDWGSGEQSSYSAAPYGHKESYTVTSNVKTNGIVAQKEEVAETVVEVKEKKPKKEKKRDKVAAAPGEVKKIGNKNDKKLRSEEQRLQSLNEKVDLFKQQKDLVKKALAGKATMGTKIKFGDDGEAAPKAKPVALFGEDSDDDDDGKTEERFKIKKQFEGQKGEKLLELQSRFGMDERFKLDKRFAENHGEKSESEDEDAELKKQMSILEEIVGPTSKKAKLQKMQPIVRYDPSKPDHGEYKLQKKGNEAEEEESKETPLPEVSADRYFEVSSNLKSILKPEEESGFSLRNLFGGNDESTEKDPEPMLGSKSTLLTKSQKKLMRNPLEREDSSDEEVGEAKTQPITNGFPSTSSESFFFGANDPRFKEVLEFFTSAKTIDKEEFEAKRRSIWLSVKAKFGKVNKKKTTFEKKLGGKPTKNRHQFKRNNNFGHNNSRKRGGSR